MEALLLLCHILRPENENTLVLFSVQEEVKRCHRYCNHSGGQAVPKVER